MRQHIHMHSYFFVSITQAIDLENITRQHAIAKHTGVKEPPWEDVQKACYSMNPEISKCSQICTYILTASWFGVS